MFFSIDDLIQALLLNDAKLSEDSEAVETILSTINMEDLLRQNLCLSNLLIQMLAKYKNVEPSVIVDTLLSNAINMSDENIKGE